VDPYYLKYICKKINFEPKVFMSARNTNEKMTKFYYEKISRYIAPKDKILFLGLSFKENTNDLRNSKNLELLEMLSKKNKIYYYDPMVNLIEKTGENVIKFKKQYYDVVILSVPHKNIFKFIKNNLNNILKTNGYFIDLNNNYKFINKQKYKYIKL
jgi:UDP-N-acetyl-D-galactosamine dehydrogenase